MKYLKIVNKGVLDPRLIFLMGASTKTDDPTKIGEFGTGLKYAISYFIRNNIEFKLFCGEQEIFFSTETQIIGTNEFEEIYCNGKSMNITTHYGNQWVAWEALREVWCNAKDEEGSIRTFTDKKSVITGKQGHTIFYIPLTKDISDVTSNWGKYFISEAPLYEDAKIAIYRNTGENLKLYKNTVLIEETQNKSLFVYDIKDAPLNELRQYRGAKRSDIGESLLSSNKAVISLLIESIQNGDDFYETKMDWDYLTHDKKKVKDLFSGYMYLHPDSNAELKGRNVKINISLFNLLKNAGLTCEKVTKSYGGYFGGSGSGFSNVKEITYKQIELPVLKERIETILAKYNASLDFIIAVAIKCDFELMVAYPKAIFNADLVNLSDDDLESTVLIGLLQAKNKNIYKVLKRLVKILYRKNYFKDIFFGTREEKKKAVEEFGDVVELLPF